MEILYWALKKYPNIVHGEEGIKVFLKNPYDFRFGTDFWLLANRNFKDQNEEIL